MLYSQVIVTIAALSGTAAAACTNPAIRKEWRELSTEERTSYTNAVNCLTIKPSQIGLETTRYDDFAYAHSMLNNEIHNVASFLPWHRLFVQVYEDALKECGYTGSATYWDWTLDAHDVPNSPIWSATTGLGGNGDPNHTELSEGYIINCVSDGPFKNLRPAYLPSGYSLHCLYRTFNNGTSQVGNMLGHAYTPEAVQNVMSEETYDQFRVRLEVRPHGAVHSAVAGEMMPSTSPNDPLFFLHHTQVDRLWWLWQEEDPEDRYADYAGYKTQLQPGGPTPQQATLDDRMPMWGLAADLRVREVMRTETEVLCYRY
ncbi:hypothetical protein BJY04DRAFT_213793 [Aspergillus karnatakaensis]|uniref:tyrosinase family protein n=1 Tax=Aspergillus karnatakaensis TaxID=1810916 RepID=UPI003CCE2446